MLEIIETEYAFREYLVEILLKFDGPLNKFAWLGIPTPRGSLKKGRLNVFSVVVF